MKALAPHLALTMAVFFWSGNFIAGRALRDDASPLDLNFWRWSIALFVLLPFTFKQARCHLEEIKREWPRILALGFTGIAAFHVCVYAALERTTAINALLLFSTSPLIIAALSWVIRIEQISPRQFLGLVISLLGVSALITRGEWGQLETWHFESGDRWMAAGVVIWAVYSILLKSRPSYLPQPVMLLGTVVVGVLIMLPFQIGIFLTGNACTFDAPGLLVLAYVGIFASVVAFLLWNFGLLRLGPVKAGLSIYLMPVFGAALSVILLDEGLAFYQLIGAAFVFTGIALFGWRKKGPLSLPSERT